MAAELDPDFEDLKENRFAHLLKPIRDLQDNFNIDLAHELEEYLEQLENAQFAFEGSRHVMVDFAEAALLIQGSAVVFSKKVEYLYNLTYQALEAVKGRRRPDGQQLDGDAAGQPVAAGRGRRAAAARGADDDEDDGLEHFWEVEDQLKECTDLDLAPDEGVMPNAGTVVRPPAALMALEDHGTGASGGGKGDGDSGVYRLQQCVVHCSGALLLDPRDGDMYDVYLRFIGPQPRQDKGLEQLIAAHRVEHATQPLPMPATQPFAPGPDAQRQPVAGDGAAPMDLDPGPAQDFDNDDGGGGYGDGGDWQEEDDGGLPAAAGDAAGPNPKPKEMAASGDPEGVATAEYADGRPRRRAASVGTGSVGGAPHADGAAAVEDEEEVFDPYKPLDPNTKSRLPDRPIVVRKPRKPQRRAPKAAGAHGAGNMAAAAGAGGLMLPEFNYCLAFLRPAHTTKEDRQEKFPKSMQKRRGERIVRAPDIPAPVFDARDAAAAAAADEAAAADAADGAAEPQAEQPYFDDDDDGGGFGGGGGGSDLDDDIDPAAAGPGGFGGDGDGWHNPADDEAWPGTRERFPGMVPPMGRLSGSEGGAGLDGDEPSYEELCRAHIESMMQAAAAREVQTDLARRVSGWRQRIDPLLKAEETRPAFDIQDYGELILSRLSNLEISDDDAQDEQQVAAGGPKGGQPHFNFSKVARDLKKYEVSRMFSAMLQLINNRNVAIYKADSSRVPPGEVPDEPFRLELLSKDMYHKTMGARLNAPAGGGAPPATDGGDGGGEHDDGENRGATQPGRKAGGGGRGKQVGAAKRAKRAAAEPLGDVNMED